jgi:tRNA-specific 2-thiouridylase
MKAKDDNKDQTYFLYRVTKEALQKTLFPLGGYTKPQVRLLAEKFGLVTAKKKESMGICFVGKVGIKDFLLYELGPQKPGKIIDDYGNEVGQHDGAIFYTIGQRHGLNMGGGLPFYVTGKNMAKNEVYVTTKLDNENLWTKQLRLNDVHWINGEALTGPLTVRTRHRAPLVAVERVEKTNTGIALHLKDEIRAVTAGQSAVMYTSDVCVGGGIII